MTKRRIWIVGAALLPLSLACLGSWWLLGRMSVGTYRHALNHPEAGKDTLAGEIRAACGEVSRRFWVNADDQRYVTDPRAHSNEVYRYIVLDAALLAAPPCTSRIVRAAADVVRMHGRLHRAEGGNWSEATRLITAEMIPLLEQAGAHAELARAWRLVALTRQIAGAYGLAGEAILKVVTHARAAGDDRLLTRGALGLTFNALYGSTTVQEALQQCEGFVTGEMSDRLVQGLIKCKLAQLRAMGGDFAAARAMYHEARNVFEELGPSVKVATTSCDLAYIELLADDPAAAERAVRADYDALVQLGANYLLSGLGVILARAVRGQGRDEEALELTRTVEASAADDDVDAQVLWRAIRAPILARAGKMAEAHSLALAAVKRARRTEMPALHGLALVEFSTVLHLAGRIEEACAAVTEAVAIYSAKGDVVSTARSKDLLARIESAR